MRKILSIALNDLRITFSDRSIWIFLVLMPAVLIFGVGFANGASLSPSGTAEHQRSRVDVIDHDNTELSAALLANLRATDTALVLCPMDNDADDFCQLGDNTLTTELAAQRLEDEVTTALIEIPQGFAEIVLAGETADLIYRSDEDLTVASPTLAALQAASQRVSGAAIARNLGAHLAEAELDGDADYANAVYERAAELWSSNPITIDAVTADVPQNNESGQPGFQQSVPGMGSMYVMFTVFAGAVILIQERKQWTLQRLVTMPVTRGQFLAGKILARFVMGMIQFFVAFGVGIIIGYFFDVSYGNSPIALLLVMSAFTLCVSAITLLVATLVSNEQQASGITLLLALTLAPIGGAWWSLDFEFIPQFMKQIAVASPIYWVMDGFNAVIREGGGIMSVLPAVGVLLAMAVVMFGIAITRFRVE